MFLVDWAVKMRIRPPEFETSICDAKYHVSLVLTRSLGLGRGERVAELRLKRLDYTIDITPQPNPKLRRPLLSQTPPPPPCAAAVAARLRRKIVSGQFDEENPFVLISSVLLVQADEGVSFLVVDRIGDFYRNLPRRADVIVTTVGARHKCQQHKTRGIERFVTTYDEGMRDTGTVELLFMYYELMDPCVHDMVKWQHRGVTYRDPEVRHVLLKDKTRGIERFVTTYDEGMRDTGTVELLFMYYELMDPCVHDMVKWQHRGVTYRDPEIEHAEPLGSLGLNDAGDDPAEFTPTGVEDI
ncbi:tyrosine kinase [Dorcoceras hygrometricum]|uniref:Tyrosine kinase n=1 Tax=Dorcoceras hygrometricum TaxID=472368 RepID=A0A2Z7AZI2_9LAMI|nr:tyrosine kinase [Dorcoceras hygrometricum]